MNNWIQGIIIAVIINTIVELIIPNGKNKKYIRTVMGIYITFTILSPIISSVKNNDFNLKDIIEKYQVKNYSIETSIDTNEYIENTYILKIKQDIEDKLLKKGYEVTNSNITIENEDENTYGEIIKISLNLNKIESDNKVEIVEKVKVDINKSKQKEKQSISEEEKEEIKEYLESIYGTSKEDIEIYA